MEPGLVTLVDGLLDRLADAPAPDLVADFAACIPVEVIGNLLAVPKDQRGPLRGWSLAILSALEPAPDAALLEMPDGMSPALVVERFDIRRGPADQRRLAMEDFCSILDLPASAKYDGTIERMARGLRPLSTDPASDLDIMFRRAVFAWLIADGDMHLKNLAVLKVAEVDAKAFTSVRFAPLYDAVTTRVFPGLGGDRMALKLNGKDDRLTRQDFLALARTIGVSAGDAETAIADLTARVAQADPARGQLLYTQYGCIGCHGTAVNGPAPYIGGTGSRAATRRAGYSATAYLYESITNPNAFIVQGYPTGLMPQNFKQTIPESDLLNLIAYIAGQ
jgi:mono/diheme cytochrome c family protein